MGKSAQIGLHTWLPDAMEGPTPVSALIHAATMVTAGVFMVCRLSPMFEYAPIALELVTYVGAITCFFAATVGLCQNDIKRVIAYSTCSQLGYMFLAAGVSAYGAAIFHLATHAFFKALLFMCAGSVIHAVSDEQDMRKMGGLKSRIPATHWLMVIGSLSLAGIGYPHVVGFAGFHSKDMIIEAAYSAGSPQGTFAFWAAIAAAFLTAFYSWRLLYLTFHGQPRMDKETWDHVHESPKVMILPLFLLAFGAIFGGILGHHAFIGEGRMDFWGDSLLVLSANDSIEAAHHHLPVWVAWLPLIVAIAGIAMAFWFYKLNPSMPGAVARSFRPLYLLFLNKWYFDELFDAVFVKPCRVARAGVLEDRRRCLDRRPGAGRHCRRDPGSREARRTAAVRLRLPLCLCHADRRRRPGHLVHPGAGGLTGHVRASSLALGHHLHAADRRLPYFHAGAG